MKQQAAYALTGLIVAVAILLVASVPSADHLHYKRVVKHDYPFGSIEQICADMPTVCHDQ